MEIFSLHSRFISNLVIKYRNNEIDQKMLNDNIFADLAFNYYFFKKKNTEANKIKKKQSVIFKDFIKKEADQEAENNKLKEKVRNKQETSENAQAIMKERKKVLMTDLFQHKGVGIYAEHSFNSYIPPKNLSLSLNFHLKYVKEYKKYVSESNTNINYKNPILNSKKDKIYIPYDESPFIIDEKTDPFILNQEKTNQEKDVIKNIKEEKINKIKEITNDIEDDTLFYSEKIEDEDDIKNASKWLSEINDEEIKSNFNSLNEERKNNKNFNFSNFFYYETTYSVADSDPSSIFDEIPQYGDRYKKFSQYLSDKSYKNYMKKMNYNYLDLMLLNFFDLHLEFQKYNFLQKEMVAMSFVKKFILSCGICHSKLYENIIKIIAMKKGQFNFENFLDCFNPILENKFDKCQTFKYKFLLNLVKNQNTQIVSIENYKVFCNLIKGKSVYEEENCRKLNKSMIESFKNKYPLENVDDFKYFQILAIIELLVDGDDRKLSN